MLHGVDITDSRFLNRPAILRIAHYAADAHKGSIRKDGTPYVQHCIHTALIMEQIISHLFDIDDWSDERRVVHTAAFWLCSARVRYAQGCREPSVPLLCRLSTACPFGRHTTAHRRPVTRARPLADCSPHF